MCVCVCVCCMNYFGHVAQYPKEGHEKCLASSNTNKYHLIFHIGTKPALNTIQKSPITRVRLYSRPGQIEFSTISLDRCRFRLNSALSPRERFRVRSRVRLNLAPPPPDRFRVR